MPFVSVTEVMVVEASFQPTTTTFRSPTRCAAEYASVTVLFALLDVVDLTWTNAMPGAVDCVTAVAVFE